MTTLIIDEHSGSCDSMWSDQNGLEVHVPVNKYLFVPTLDPFELHQSEKIGAPKIIFYCGSYEQIILHQAFSLGILDESQYSTYANNAVLSGHRSFGYVEILLDGWEPISHDNIENRLGILYGGTGGNHASFHYTECYSTKLAVEEAIKIDPRSGPPISHYYHTLNGEDYFENLDYTGNKIVQNVYLLTSEYIISMQMGVSGGNMKDIKYSGCTTSATPEAPAINISNVISRAQKSRRLISQRNTDTSGVKFRSDMEITPEKVEFKMIKA